MMQRIKRRQKNKYCVIFMNNFMNWVEKHNLWRMEKLELHVSVPTLLH